MPIVVDELVRPVAETACKGMHLCLDLRTRPVQSVFFDKIAHIILPLAYHVVVELVRVVLWNIFRDGLYATM